MPQNYTLYSAIVQKDQVLLILSHDGNARVDADTWPAGRQADQSAQTSNQPSGQQTERQSATATALRPGIVQVPSDALFVWCHDTKQLQEFGIRDIAALQPGMAINFQR